MFINGNSIYFLALMIPLVTNTIPSKMVDNSSNVSYCDVVGQTQLSSNPSYVILLWCIVSFIFVAFLYIFGLICYYTFLSRHLPRVFLYFLQILVFLQICKHGKQKMVLYCWIYYILNELINSKKYNWTRKTILNFHNILFCQSCRGFLECCKKFNINSYFYSGFALNIMFRHFLLVKRYESFATSNKRTLQKDIFYAFINYSDSND